MTEVFSIRPLPGYVLISDAIPDVPETTLIIPEYSKDREMPCQGYIFAIGGSPVTKNGVVLNNEFKQGDKVLFKKFSALWMEYKGKKLLHLKSGDVMAVIEEIKPYIKKGDEVYLNPDFVKSKSVSE